MRFTRRIAGTHVGSRTEYLFFWFDMLIASLSDGLSSRCVAGCVKGATVVGKVNGIL